MGAMKGPVATALGGAAILTAAAVGLVRPWGGAGRGEPIFAPPDPGAAAVEDPAAQSLPPGHPPIEGAESPLPPDHPRLATAASTPGATRPPLPNEDEPPPAIRWNVPAGWQTLPNPTSMRIATYRPTPDSELLVVRAGGSTDANIQRWIGQFDEGAQSTRSRKTIQGLAVEVVEATGTYTSSGMVPGESLEAHPGWGLLGAVVEAPGSKYFFKLVGPSAEVRAARASFDALIGSIRPL
jgi:hypothetical protein